MTFIPRYVLGFSSTAFNIYIIFIAIHTVLIHANTRINFGPIKYTFTTPQYHHLHHCEDPKYYGHNFASIFPFIDMIFGAYYLPDKKWPAGTGVHEVLILKDLLNNPFTHLQKVYLIQI